MAWVLPCCCIFREMLKYTDMRRVQHHREALTCYWRCESVTEEHTEKDRLGLYKR